MTTVADAHAALAQLRSTRTTRVRFSSPAEALDADWGYAVQDVDRSTRTGAGEVVVGAKLGLTSRAKQLTMGVHEPIVGFLTDAMDIGTRGAAAVLATTAQPRVEPEVAFRLAEDLDRPVPPWRIRRWVDAVTVALELIDSRYTGYAFGLPDVLADNASAAGFRVGSWTAPGVDLASAGCVVSVDGRVVHTGTTAAILGHPLRALVHLAQHVADRGEVLPAGSVVLAGALTDAVPVQAGSSYVAEVRGLGRVELGA